MSTSRGRWVFLVLCLLSVGCARDPLDNLILRLNDSDVAVRRTAARALCLRQNVEERVVAELIKRATDKDVEVRHLTIEALGKLGPEGKSSIPILKLALADREKRVRLDAALAIVNIDPQDNAPRPVLITAMREGDGRTLLAIRAIGANAAWTVRTLIGLLSHESPQVRALAARTLGRIGPAAREAKPALEAARRDVNAAVQRVANDALAKVQENPGHAAK